MDTEYLLGEIINAHGGSGLWNSLTALEAEVSARGLLFTAKHRRVLEKVRVTAFTREPRFVFHDFPCPGMIGELIGPEDVRIRDSNGDIVRQRKNPREAFRGLKHLLYWDDLDFLYFGGYATWNYLTTPFIFLRPGFSFKVPGTPAGVSASWTGLRVTFPDDIPTHCRDQVFYFDENRLLRRLDYTAEVVGGWARAAHFCGEYRNFGGIMAATKRRVLPIVMGSRPLPGPLLVGIDLHRMRPV